MRFAPCVWRAIVASALVLLSAMFAVQHAGDSRFMRNNSVAYCSKEICSDRCVSARRKPPRFSNPFDVDRSSFQLWSFCHPRVDNSLMQLLHDTIVAPYGPALRAPGWPWCVRQVLVVDGLGQGSRTAFVSEPCLDFAEVDRRCLLQRLLLQVWHREVERRCREKGQAERIRALSVYLCPRSSRARYTLDSSVRHLH